MPTAFQQGQKWTMNVMSRAGHRASEDKTVLYTEAARLRGPCPLPIINDGLRDWQELFNVGGAIVDRHAASDEGIKELLCHVVSSQAVLLS